MESPSLCFCQLSFGHSPVFGTLPILSNKLCRFLSLSFGQCLLGLCTVLLDSFPKILSLCSNTAFFLLHPSTHPFIHLASHRYADLSTHYSLHPSIPPSVQPSIHLAIHPSIFRLSIHLSFHPSILPIHSSIYPPTHPFYLSYMPLMF